jgi:uncharacterized protein (DUF2461 family)
MSFAGFAESTFQFLAELARHNEQSWFEAHRADCDSALVEPAKALVEAKGDLGAKANIIEAFVNLVQAQTNKSITAANAAILTPLGRAL